MKRVFKSKKGIEFLPLLLVFLLPVLVYLSIVIVGGIDDSGYSVGQMSKDLFDTYDNAYKLDSYIKNSVRIAIPESISENSNNLFNSTCGEYMGYVLINNQNDECFKNHKKVFVNIIENKLENALKQVDVSIDYNLEIVSENPLVIKGESETIPIPIYKDETLKN